MDALLNRQNEILREIEKININFKKDSSSRKTPDYIKLRTKKLEELFAELESNDRGISTYPYQKTDYNLKGIFEQIRDYYTSTLSMITSYTPIPEQQAGQSQPSFEIPNHEFKTPTKQDRGENSKTDDLMKKQSSNFRAFTRTVDNINLEAITEKWEFEDILKTIQARWSAIDSLHWEIDSELEGSNSVYEKAFTSHELKYNGIKKAINSKLWSVSHIEKYTPQMKTPEFSGNYHHWQSFKDLFRATIHNNPTLSDGQKMQFLKTKVKGEAERLIQHLPVTSDNYKTSWDILQHRYDNKKLIFNSHISIMLNIPNMQQPTVNHIKNIHDSTLECLNAIKNLGVDIDTWDPLLVYLLSQKLDTQTHNDYLESLKQPRDLPTIKDFLNFLEGKFTSMEAARQKQEGTVPKTYTANQILSSGTTRNPKHFIKNTRNFRQCPLCKENHGIYYCEKFLEMSPTAKARTVAKLNLCSNCLFNHNGKPCIATKRCQECKGNHNTILHAAFNKALNPTPKVSMSVITTESIKQTSPSVNTAQISQNEPPQILLATAVVKVQALDGTYHELRALIDQGSQISLISEAAAQRLSLRRQKNNIVVTGVGIKNNTCKGQVVITAQSKDEKYTFNTDALVMRNLLKSLPNRTFIKPTSHYLSNISLADPDFNIQRPVDILLGAEVYANIIMKGIRRSDEPSMIAQQTRLGWLLFGKVSSTSKKFNVNTISIDELEKFWEIEDISDESTLSTEDNLCIQYYQETTNRKEDGRYEVKLPLQSNFAENIGKSRNKAVAQFLHIEQKLNKHDATSREYKRFMNEYRQLQHMKPADRNSAVDCYLSHHGVRREESSTTSLRVVFNASSPTSSGKSLNDFMARGPNLQQDLQSLILKWRQYPIAFTADIEKMFRQIWVHPDDQALQKIIWRDSPDEPIKDYQLTTITYGTKAAPFLAMMTLKQLAKDERDNYQGSQAPKVIAESFYMDDLLHGSYTIQEATELKQDLIEILKAGGFNLRKWSSNHPLLLQSDNTPRDKQDDGFEFKQAESTKTLGLRWNTHQDSFTFQSKIDIAIQVKITKRMLLSDISKIFDPLGWLTPLSTKLKLLFQQVWDSNCKWEDQLPENILQEWIKIKTDIYNINEIKVPRWLGIERASDIELHGFSDSSMKAFAAVIYIKINNINKPKVVLVAAKSRIVSKKKNTSLPRLELCGAELLARLMDKIQQCLPGHNIKKFGWTDSTAVLGWIQGNVNRWKPFVAHRVSRVKDVIGPECWRYVKSADNPADCASRGITATQLKNHPSWWSGPGWLTSYTPEKEAEIPTYKTNEEVKKLQAFVVQSDPENKQDNHIITQLLVRYSSFNKIVRTLAWVRRYITSKQERAKNTFLTLQEITSAKTEIIKHVQQLHFSSEIKNLKSNKKIDSRSKILNLNPYLDDKSVLRVGGRLKNANISEDMKHPIIIPHDSLLTNLLIDDAHSRTFHGGARLTLSHTRMNYWIIGGNRAIKKRLLPCVICRRHKPSKHHQLMGDLPEARVNPSRPFSHTGVDFTGHVDVKTNKGRGVKTTKGYVAVFVCMSTKAVHLELVSDLTSSSFLAALRRLAARRGAPRHVYSDNATNFTHASKMLKQEFINLQNVTDDSFFKEITDMNIEWHFQAPSWPSASGLMEAAVKSLKHHLRRVLGEQKLTYEEFATLLSQLEACLNTRPLCAISEDPDDLNFLTPSHFLANGPTLTIVNTEKDERTRWHYTQKIFNDIWKRWRLEYLVQLQARSKWTSAKDNIKVNDVVLIHDANLPPGKWSMGRVIELHPGKDGYIRVVTLKTKNGLMKRPIVKLSILPINDNRNESEPKPNKGASKRSALSSAILAFIYFLTMLTTCCAQTIIPVNQDQGLYFDKVADLKLIQDEWKVIAYYDLTPYWKGIAAYTRYSQYLETACNSIKDQTICDVIKSQLQHAFTELEYYNNVLMNHPNRPGPRRRRGLINGIGNIARSLFGVLDNEFAEQYAQDITHIQKNEKHLAVMWKKQTSIVEAEYNLLKRTEESMKNQTRTFNDHIKKLETSMTSIQREINTAEYINQLTLSFLSANNMLSSLRNVQDTILDAITSVYHGKVNVHLMSPQQLQSELNIISTQLSQDLSLPVKDIESHLQNIYHLLRIRTKMTDQYLIFEIKIPLISRTSYELYKIIPVPKQVGNNMVTVISTAEYVGINIERDTYLPILQEDINECISHDSSTYMCQVRRPIYKMKSDSDLCIKDTANQCKLKTTACKNEWVTLSKLNIYFHFCCQTCQLRTICNEQVTAAKLTGANIIKLPEKCIITTENFTVYSHKVSSSEMKIITDTNEITIPQINHIMKLSVPITNISDMVITTDATAKLLEDLGQKIEDIKNSEVPSSDDISYHDVHHYTAIYGIIFIAAVLGIYTLYRQLSRRQKATTTAPASEQPPLRLTAQPTFSTVGSSRDQGTTPVLRKVMFNENTV